MPSSSDCALTRERIHDVLWNLAAGRVGKDPKELTPETRLIHDLGADSLDIAELSLHLEQELGVELPSRVLDNPDLTLGECEQALAAACACG